MSLEWKGIYFADKLSDCNWCQLWANVLKIYTLKMKNIFLFNDVFNGNKDFLYKVNE